MSSIVDEVDGPDWEEACVSHGIIVTVAESIVVGPVNKVDVYEIEVTVYA